MASEELAARGARIVFVARDKTRAEATLMRLRERGPGLDHRVHFADLSSLADMKRVAKEIAADEPRIDVLMNNAGAMFGKRHLTEDGFERTFALNHLSYFVVTAVLRERLLATPGARIVNTSSQAHRAAHVDRNNPQMLTGFRMFKAYCLSKLYNILFTRELARQLRGTGITANALHPGFVATRFGDANQWRGGNRLSGRQAIRDNSGGRSQDVHLSCIFRTGAKRDGRVLLQVCSNSADKGRSG